MKKSEAERMKSCQLRSDIDNAMSAVSYKIYEAWENTNKALDRRAIEILEAKEKLQTQLHKVAAQEIKITIKLREFLLAFQIIQKTSKEHLKDYEIFKYIYIVLTC